MASSLVNGLTDLFKAQALGPFAAQTGESESSVLRGFETTTGTMLTGLASRLGQSGFGRQIFDLISSPANNTGVLDNVRSLVTAGPDRSSDSPGPRLLSMLFGGQQSAIGEAIGRASGLRGSSVASMLSMAAPLLLGWLGRRVRDGGMDVSKLTGFLSQEAAGVRGALPAEVRNLVGGETRDEYATVPPVAAGVVRERSNRWLWPLLLGLLILALLIWWFARRPHAGPAEVATTATDLVTRHLPNNVDLRLPTGRMEDNLLAFIQSPRPVDDTTWFDFDRLLFDTNSATLQPSSQEQLHNVAEILKAYPNVHVKIGGYTDNTGDPNANLRLSQQRADSVKQELTGLGVSADRMEAQGYGDQHPVADNSTEEGRQKNRRISLRVTQK
ncbi:MAG TPA: OmpA family protein [Bryobacteraceae bacterium]